MGTVQLMIMAATTAGLLSTPWLGEAIDAGADVAVTELDAITELVELGAELGLDSEAGAWVIVFDEPDGSQERTADVRARTDEYGNARRAR